MTKCSQMFGCHNCRDEMNLIRIAFKGMKEELHKLEKQLDSTMQFIACIDSTDEKED